MSQGAPRRGWGRTILEGLLIVLSILLAFGIEAGWSELGERQAEVEALHGLHDDFVQTVDRLVEASTEHARIRTAGVRLLSMTGPNAETSDSDITLDSLVMTLIHAPIAVPVMATYDALIASGQVEILSSGEFAKGSGDVGRFHGRRCPRGAGGQSTDGSAIPSVPLGLHPDCHTRSQHTSRVR